MPGRYRSYERPSSGGRRQGFPHERRSPSRFAFARGARRGGIGPADARRIGRFPGPDRAGGVGVSGFPFAPSAPAGGAPPARPDAASRSTARPRLLAPGVGLALGRRLAKAGDAGRRFPAAVRRRPAAHRESDLRAALEATLAALVAENVKTSPIGAGDWRAAREAIKAFYAARDFAPVWVTEQGLTPAADLALARLAEADVDGLDLSAFALPKGPLADLSPRASPRPRPSFRRRWSPTAMQASGARVAPGGFRRRSRRGRAWPIRGKRWPPSPSPPTLAPRSRPSIHSKNPISSCATN